MRRFFAFMIFICAFTALPLRADFSGLSVDMVRMAVDAEDYDFLEGTFQSALEEATKTKNFEALRDTYTQLFATANDVRRLKVDAWLEQYPNSAFAATALAWSHYYMAFMYRGDAGWSSTAPQAREAFHQQLLIAKVMTDLALEISPDFPPALDAAIILKQTHIDRTPLQSVLDHALTVAPDRHTLKLALNADQPKWGGDIQAMTALCAEMAARVPEYDAELCMIEAVFDNGLKGPVRSKALIALEGRDEAFLDYARLDAYSNEWSDRENAARKAQRLLRATLGKGSDVSISTFKRQLRHLDETFRLPLYKIEMQDALVASMRNRLQDNPQAPVIHELLIRDRLERSASAFSKGNPKETMEMWQDMLAYGRYQPRVWRLGRDVDAAMFSWLNAERQGWYYVNEIYYSNHNPASLDEYMSHLYYLHQVSIGKEVASEAVDISPDALKEDVLCPMFRSYRLFESICQADPSALECNVNTDYFGNPDLVRKLMMRSDDCGWVKGADIEALLFSPIPTDKFLNDAFLEGANE